MPWSPFAAMLVSTVTGGSAPSGVSTRARTSGRLGALEVVGCRRVASSARENSGSCGISKSIGFNRPPPPRAGIGIKPLELRRAEL
jgi:hypothetical protein